MHLIIGLIIIIALLIHFFRERRMNGEEYREKSIAILAKAVLRGHIIFHEVDDYNYEFHYTCKYCKMGLHTQDRRCRNTKYFKHALNCPVLIARDFLAEEGDE